MISQNNSKEIEKNNKALKVVVGGGMLVLFGMVFSKIITYIYDILLARVLGPEGYGLIVIGMSLVQFFTVLSIVGLGAAIIRYIAIYKTKKDEEGISSVIWSSLLVVIILGLFYGLILLLFAKQIAVGIFHNEKLIPILRIFSFAVLLSGLGTTFEYFIKAFKKVKYIVFIRNIFENLLKVSLIGLVFYIGFRVTGATFSIVFTFALSFLLLFYFFHKKIHRISLTKPNKIKTLLKFSIPLFLSGIFGSLMGWLDSFLLGYFKTIESVGIYNAASPLAMVLLMVPQAIAVLFYPVLTEMHTKKENIKPFYQTVTRWIFLINILIAFILIIFSKSFLGILFGGIYIQGYVVLIILAIGYFIYSISYPAMYGLYTLNKTKIIFLNSTVAFFINLIVDILLIPRFGIVGAAIGSTIGFFVLSLLMHLEFYKFTKIFAFNLGHLKIILVGIISIPLGLFWSNILFNKNLFILIAFLIISVIFYGFFLFVVGGLKQQDKMLFDSIKNKLKGGRRK